MIFLDDQTSISTGEEILLSAEFADFAGSDHDRANCAKWKVDKDRARATYRFRPSDTARLAAAERMAILQQAMAKATNGDSSEDVPPPYEFTIEDYDFERVGGLGSEVAGGLVDITKVPSMTTLAIRRTPP